MAACAEHVLYLFSTLGALMSEIFCMPWRVERDHAGGTETVVEHATFTVVFGAYLACAASNPTYLYRVMNRARIVRQSDQDAAVAAFAAMSKDSDRRTGT